MKELGLGQLKLSCNRGEWTAGAECRQHGWLQGLKYGPRYAFRQPNGWVTECEKGRLVMAG